MACQINRTTIRKGIADSAAQMMDNSNLFNRVLRTAEVTSPNLDKYFQLNTGNFESSIKALDDYLIEYLEGFNIKVKELDDLKARLGIDAIGATDIVNKLIYLSKNRNVETVPEEFGHMITFLLGAENKYIIDLINTVQYWTGYQDVYDQYMPIYNNEKQVKIEAIGKLIAKALVKNYKAYGTDYNILRKAINAISDFFKRLGLMKDSIAWGDYPAFIADRIALDVLSGTQVANEFPAAGRTKVDFNTAINSNPNAKNIYDRFRGRPRFKMTGSLAIALQGDIFRDANELIHDLDYVTYGNQDDLDRLSVEMESIGGILFHPGWKHQKYTTYTWLIPLEGTVITDVKRNSKGWISDFKVNGKSARKADGKVDTSKAMAVDFFWYKEEPSADDFMGVATFNDVFSGKMMLSSEGDKERLFLRDKDTTDWTLFRPDYEGDTESSFMYYQLSPVDEFEPKEENKDHISTVNEINQQFGGNVINKTDAGTYIVNPSESVINKYMSIESKDIPHEVDTNDRNDVLAHFGLEPNSTPQDFIDNKMQEYKGAIERARKINPLFTIEFGEEISSFDPNTNKIFISIDEVYHASEVSGIDADTVMSFAIMHEIGHAASYYGLEANSDSGMQEVLKIALENNKVNPFYDQLRGGYSINGIPYSFTSIHELASDAMSNPYLQEWLDTIPYKGTLTLWGKIVDFILRKIGIRKTPTLYTQVIKIISSERIKKDTADMLDRPSADWPKEFVTQNLAPKNYIDATHEAFTDPSVKDEIDQILKKLPRAIISMKQALKDEVNEDRRKSLKKVLDAVDSVQTEKDSINLSISMLKQAGVIVDDISKQIALADKITDDTQKLIVGYNLKQSAHSIESIVPLARDILFALDREELTNYSIKPFVAMLTKIVDVTAQADYAYRRITKEPSIQKLIDLAGDSKAEKRILAEIDKLKDEIAKATNPNIKDLHTRTLKIREEELRMIANKDTINRVFDSNHIDASETQRKMETLADNKHPVIAVVYKDILSVNREVTRKMNSIANEHQRQQDKLMKNVGVKSIRDVKKFYNHITTTVSIADKVVENDKGELTVMYVNQRMLLSHYSPEYIKDYTTLKLTEEYYYQKNQEAKEKGDPQLEKEMSEKLAAANKAKFKFIRDNSVNKVSDSVMEMYDILDRELTKDDGTTTTFSAERGSIFRKIEEIEERRELSFLPSEQEKIQQELDHAYRILKELRSPWDANGNPKVGFELELQKIAEEFATEKTKHGKYILSEKGKKAFTDEIEQLERNLAEGAISRRLYESRLSEMIITETDEDYHTIAKMYDEEIADLMELVSKIPEFSKVFANVDKEKIRTGYQKLRDLVRAFRDNEQTIDGQEFSKVRPQLVAEIKSIQEENEKLRLATEGLGGLTFGENIRFSELKKIRKSGEITDEEMEELEGYYSRKNEAKVLYDQYSDILDRLAVVQRLKTGLNESLNSSYYENEYEHQKSILINSIKSEYLDKMKTASVLLGGRYQKSGNTWRRLIREDNGVKDFEIVQIAGFATQDEAVAHEIANYEADNKMSETKWYKDNHYEKYVFNDETYEWELTQSPIYIWIKSEPADKSFIKERQPSIKYRTYELNPEHVNNDYTTIDHSIPSPKQGKYVNDEYLKLKNSNDPKDKAYFEYLEFIRESYNEAQKYYPPAKKMGDILPSFTKTSDEVAVELTKSVANRAKGLYNKNTSIAVEATDNPDEQLQVGGSTTNYYAKNRILPTPFANRMDQDKQSSDIPAMILGFTSAALKYNLQIERQPLYEALRAQIEDIKVLETKAYGKDAKLPMSLSPSSTYAALKQEITKKEIKKEIPTTNVLKTFEHMLDTFVYGETKYSANVTAGGYSVDLNKVTSGLKRLSSTAIFALNGYSAVKNSTSALIQAALNANIGEGYFTKSQYLKSKGEAIWMTGQYLKDLTKYGNKTLIGQELDYFQVVEGFSYDSYGKKTAWTVMKNKTDFLTSLKNISEFELQVSQYLAMSKANPVEVDGEMVEFRKAFTIDKDGNFVPKPGAKVDRETIEGFMNRLAYVNRVINGAYRQEEKNGLQKHILGDLVFYLNGYFVPAFVNRWGSKRPNHTADLITYGYHRQMIDLVGNLLRHGKGIRTIWKDMTAEEKARIFRSRNELLTVLSLFLMCMVLGSDDDKEELEKNSGLHNWTLAVLLGVKSETETFLPAPTMGLNEISRKITSPFAALRQITNLIALIENTTYLLVGSEKAYYKQSGIKDGFHDKGDAKAVANLMKIIGWSGTGFDGTEKLTQVRRIQNLR